MNSRRLFFVLIAVVIAINAGGVALLVFGNKLLDKQNSKLTELKVEANTLDSVQQSLVKAKKDVEKYKDLAQVVETVVPQEKDQARTIRELVQIADESGVSIDSINFPSSTLGNSDKPGGAAPAASTGTTNTQTQKVDGLNNVERLEITITSSKQVSYSNFILFLQKLEQNRRTAQVSSITVTPAGTDKSRVNFSMVLNVYIKKAGA
jgi:uncharacterized membrane-anchored protein YhcB (DUF1043 family)